MGVRALTEAVADETSIQPPPTRGGGVPGGDGQALVVEVVARHAEGLLRLARRHSLCASDAEDAYQRGLEIFIRHSDRLDPERAASWLRTVVKHEAMAVRKTRQRDLAPDQYDFDAVEASSTASPEEQVAGFERVARSAEALGTLKPQEVHALWLRAQGNSYEEIQEQTGWTRTKVNRCLYEGRRAFLSRYAGIEAGDECRRWEPSLSALVDGEASQGELMALRPHLRSCHACRATVREIHRSSRPVAAVLPVALLGGVGAGVEEAGHVALRAWEAVMAWLAERAAMTVTRAQALMELIVASAGKGTAVVAAGAAIASGSAVVLEQSGTGREGSSAPVALRAGLAGETGRALESARRAARIEARRREAAQDRLRDSRPVPAVPVVSGPASEAPAPQESAAPAAPAAPPAEAAPAADPAPEFGLE